MRVGPSKLSRIGVSSDTAGELLKREEKPRELRRGQQNERERERVCVVSLQ